MSDYFSSLLLALQREGHRDAPSQSEHDRELYALLYGSGEESAPSARPRAWRGVAAALALGAAAVGCGVLAARLAG
jgi:hypothetical protein